MDPDTGVKMSPERYGQCIGIPTAHIWGSNDALYPTFGPVLSELCTRENQEVYIHDGGHEIPGPKDLEAVKAVVAAIRRTIERATLFC